MAAKVVEANAGVHSLAISVAVGSTFLFLCITSIGYSHIARNELASLWYVGQRAL